VGLAVLEGIRLVGDDLSVCGRIRTIGRQVEEREFSRSIGIGSCFIGRFGRINRERLGRLLFRVVGMAIQGPAVEVVVAGTAVVMAALSVDTATVSQRYTG
jgi:hypothetical protein